MRRWPSRSTSSASSATAAPTATSLTLADNLAYQIGFNDFGSAVARRPDADRPQGRDRDDRRRRDLPDAPLAGQRRQHRPLDRRRPQRRRAAGAGHAHHAASISLPTTKSAPNSIGLDHEPAQHRPPAQATGAASRSSNDLDRADGRFDHEEVGVFLNYVNHADIRYGGGQVNVDSVFEVVTPINMTDRRPTVTHNTDHPQRRRRHVGQSRQLRRNQLPGPALLARSPARLYNPSSIRRPPRQLHPRLQPRRARHPRQPALLEQHRPTACSSAPRPPPATCSKR